MSEPPADLPQPPRTISRAARLSRLGPVDAATPASPPGTEIDPLDTAGERDASPRTGSQPAVDPVPQPTRAAASTRVVPQPAGRASSSRTDDLVGLAQAIASASATHPTADPSTELTRGASATADAPTRGQGAGPVRFKPLVDPWADRSVIVSTFGLVLCFFPPLAMIGLVMAAISLRRISGSDGALTGARTARFGVMLGAAGTALGGALWLWLFLTR